MNIILTINNNTINNYLKKTSFQFINFQMSGAKSYISTAEC